MVKIGLVVSRVEVVTIVVDPADPEVIEKPSVVVFTNFVVLSVEFSLVVVVSNGFPVAMSVTVMKSSLVGELPAVVELPVVVDPIVSGFSVVPTPLVVTTFSVVTTFVVKSTVFVTTTFPLVVVETTSVVNIPQKQ